MQLKFGLGLVMGMIVLVLSGCVGQQQMSMRLTDEGALVAVCADLAIDGIQIAAVSKAGDHESVELWKVQGDVISVPAGRTFEYGAEVIGFEEVTPPSHLNVDGRYIDVHLLANDGETIYGSHLDGDKLSEDQWLGSDNQLRDTAC